MNWLNQQINLLRSSSNSLNCVILILIVVKKNLFWLYSESINTYTFSHSTSKIKLMILPPRPGYQKCLFFNFCRTNPYISHFPECASCPAHLILSYLIIVKTKNCDTFHCVVAFNPSFFNIVGADTRIHFSTVLSKTLNPCYYFRLWMWGKMLVCVKE